MDVVKIIRQDRPVVKLVRVMPGQLALIRPASAMPVKLILNRGSVTFNNGNETAETLPIGTRLSTYYQLKKQA